MKSASRLRSIIVLLVIAIAVRMFVGYVFYSNGYESIVDDSLSYTGLAEDIVNKTVLKPESTSSRTLGYPLIIALCMKCMGSNYMLTLTLVQNFFNILCVFAAYEIVRLLTDNEKVSFIAGLIVALDVHNIYFNFIVLTDCVTQSVTMIGFLFFVRLLLDLKYDCKIGWDLFLSSIFMAYGVLCRPAQMFLPFCLGIGMIVAGFVYKQKKKIFIMVFTVFIFSLAVIILWSYRNYILGRGFSYSDISVHNMYRYNSVVVFAKQNNLSYYEAFDMFKYGKDPGLAPYLKTMTYNEAIKARAKELILSDVPYYIQCCAKDALYYLFYPGIMDWPAFNESVQDIIGVLKSSGLSVETAKILLKPHNLIACSLIGIDVFVLFAFFVSSCIGLVKLFIKEWVVASLFTGVFLYNLVVSVQPVTIGSYPRFRLTTWIITVVLAVICFCKKGRLQDKSSMV